MDRLVPRRLVSELNATAVPITGSSTYRRPFKIAGDVLWCAFMAVILSSVALGPVARLFT